MGGGGGAQRPVWHVYKPKKTGAHSARARTRGQNPLVIYRGLHGFFKLVCIVLAGVIAIFDLKHLSIYPDTTKAKKQLYFSGQNISELVQTFD
jgi:hypothetical protein